MLVGRHMLYSPPYVQKQSLRGVFQETCSANIQTVSRRTSMLKFRMGILLSICYVPVVECLFQQKRLDNCFCISLQIDRDNIHVKVRSKKLKNCLEYKKCKVEPYFCCQSFLCTRVESWCTRVVLVFCCLVLLLVQFSRLDRLNTCLSQFG